jgi:hypothetical protein
MKNLEASFPFECRVPFFQEGIHALLEITAQKSLDEPAGRVFGGK